MVGATGRILRRIDIDRFSKTKSPIGGRAMVTASIASDFVDLLGEAAKEIANLDGPANPVCCELRELQRQLRPQKRTIRELAHLVDVSPRDVLDAAMAVGVQQFWHQGQFFRNRLQLEDYLTKSFHLDPVPELELELTTAQAEQLSLEMDISIQSPQSFNPDSPTIEGGLEKLMMDAAVEIAMLDGTDNELFRRLLTELQQQSKSHSSDQHETIAARISVTKPPRKFAPSDSDAPARSANRKKHSG